MQNHWESTYGQLDGGFESILRHFKNPVSKNVFFVAFFSTRVNDTSNANRCRWRGMSGVIQLASNLVLELSGFEAPGNEFKIAKIGFPKFRNGW
jgi:hypothetical protein